MNLSNILRKSWQILWHYRALWLFGTILALVGANTIYPISTRDWENNDQWAKIKLSDTTTIQVPGIDMTLDLTAPGGFRLITPDSTSWREFRGIVEEIDRELSLNLWPILIEFAVILLILLVLGAITRYIVETAVIRMVNDAEQTGKYLTVWQGLRRGISFGAWRLFILDLTVGILSFIVFTIVIGLAVTPILLAIGSQDIVLITAGAGTFSLLIIAFYLWLAVSAILSLVLQTVRRACVLEKQSLLTSIRQGIRLTKHHLKKIAPVWLIWMGLRLLWVPFLVPIMILLFPIFLLAIILGVAAGSLPAVLVAIIAALFMGGATPWIMGALAGLPIFILVMISPILFVSGFVEIYKSSIWTLAYRDLKALDSTVQVPVSQAPLSTTRSTAE
jgi:hypothetical protein